MNQEKIGKFIAECRKQKGMTQPELISAFYGIIKKEVYLWLE